MVKCPFPGCAHIGDVITNVHCKHEHNLKKDKLFKKYGEPKQVQFKMKGGNSNVKNV